MIRIQLWDRDLEGVQQAEVDYISFISDQTYGAPPLIAPNPKNHDAARAAIDEKVAYINPRNIGLLIATRLED